MKLSIITPNYNYAEFIGSTIESIVSQNYTDIECIIVDDGSTDNSVNIIQYYIDRYPNKIHLIRQTNCGQTLAINKALSMVTGDIIGWINSDDYFCKDVFTIIMAEFQRNRLLDAVFGDINIVDDKGQIIKVNRYLSFDYASGVFNGFGKIISSNAIFWKRELTDSVGLMRDDFQYAMDSEYWSRLLYKRKVKHIPLVVASFRWHPEAKTIKRKATNSPAFIKAKAEDLYVFENSYKNLTVSKVIQVRHANILKLLYKVKRIVLRFIHGHYF